MDFLRKIFTSFSEKEKKKKNSIKINELINAVVDGNIEKVTYLIKEKKMNLELKDILGRTALMHSILIRNGMRYFFMHYKDIDINEKKRVIENYDNIFYLLVRANTRLEYINTKSFEGKTALIYASMLGLYDYVDYLLLNGADANIEGKDNKTALMHSENKMISDRLEPVTWNKAPPLTEFIYVPLNTLCNNENFLPSYEDIMNL
jgi:ankyrin repeat protein